MSGADLRILDPLKAHKDCVTCLQKIRKQNSDSLFSSSKDKSVFHWVLDSTVESEFGKLYKQYAGKHKKRVNAVAVSSSGNMIVTVGSDNKGYIWDAESKKTTAILGEHHRDIFGVSINKDDNKIVTGSADCSIKLWNTKGMLISTFGPGFDKAHKSWVTCVSFLPSKDNIVVSGSKDGTVKIWDIDNSSLLTTFMDGCVLDYKKMEEEKIEAQDYDLSLSVTCLTFSADGSLLIYGGRNNKVYIINLQNNELVESFMTEETIRAVATGESEPIIAVGTDNSVLVWDLLNSKIISEYSLSEEGNGVSCKSVIFINNILYCGLSNGDIINFEYSKRVE